MPVRVTAGLGCVVLNAIVCIYCYTVKDLTWRQLIRFRTPPPTHHRSTLTTTLPPRTLIWRQLLRLPTNRAAFSSLLAMGTHPAYEDLGGKYPLKSRTLLARLTRVLSALAHWSPVVRRRMGCYGVIVLYG